MRGKAMDMLVPISVEKTGEAPILSAMDMMKMCGFLGLKVFLLTLFFFFFLEPCSHSVRLRDHGGMYGCVALDSGVE